MFKSAFWRQLFNFILPPRCICCGKSCGEENGICPECFNELTFISEPYCRRCGMPFEDLPLINGKMLCPNCLKEKRPMFRFCRSAVRYNEVSKRPILALKFMDHTENAAIFAQWLKTAGRDIWSNPPDLIVPVPLHYWRLMKRRYNQAALIAVELGKLTGLAVDTSSLVKHKSTRPQMSFSGKERLKNIRGVFRVKKPEHIRGKRILLVDDVWTTGSTARECAKTLKAAGALSVDVVTVARV